MGTQAETVKKPKLAAIVGKYLGKSFDEISCLGLIRAIYEDELGIAYRDPAGFCGIRTETYLPDFWARPKHMQVMLLRYARTLGESVPAGRQMPLDLLILLDRAGAVFPALYIGRGQALTSSAAEGVHCVPVSGVNRVLMVRRMV